VNGAEEENVQSIHYAFTKARAASFPDCFRAGSYDFVLYGGFSHPFFLFVQLSNLFLGWDGWRMRDFIKRQEG
jgi:hypothetical protein